MDLVGAMSATASALSALKQIKDIDQAFSKAELKAKLADIYGDLAEVRIALVDAQELIRQKDEEIKRLNAAANKPPEVFVYRGFPFKQADGKIEAGPYCPNCHDRSGLALLGRGNITILQVCPRCRGEYRHAPMRSHAQAALDEGKA